MTMRALSGESPARITIAAPSTTISDVVAPFLFERVDPNTVFIAREEAADVGYRAVSEGRADISLTIRRPPDELSQRQVAQFRLFAYVAKSHVWSARHSVRLEELSGPPLIVIPGSSSFGVLVPALEKLGLRFRIAFEVSVPKIAQALAGAGHGVAILSDDPCFGLRPLDIEGPEGALSVPLFAGWDATHYAGTRSNGSWTTWRDTARPIGSGRLPSVGNAHLAWRRCANAAARPSVVESS